MTYRPLNCAHVALMLPNVFNSDQLTVAPRAQAAAGASTFLPVVLTEDEESQARQEYERVMLAEKDEIKHYLKAIHQTLKQRG